MNEMLLARGGLSLTRLQNFLAIADAGSIAEAAGRHDTSRQSLFSRQLRELEDFFQTELTRRRGRGLELTEAGRRLAAIVRQQNRQLLDFAGESRKEALTLSIGAGNSTLEWLVIPALAGLQKSTREFRITLHDLRTEEAVQRLHELSLDFAVVRTDAVRRPLRSFGLGRITFALFVPDEFGVPATSTAKDLLKKLPIAAALGGQFRSRLDQVAERQRIAINYHLDCTSFTQASRAAALGTHAAILPTLAATSLPRSVRMVPLPFLAQAERPLSLVCNPRLLATRPSIERLRSELEHSLQQNLSCWSPAV